MKIISLESTRGGYSGLCADDFDNYIRFSITPSSRVMTSVKIPLRITSYDQFLDLWNKLAPATRFLKKPIEVTDLSLDSLRATEQKIIRDTNSGQFK